MSGLNNGVRITNLTGTAEDAITKSMVDRMAREYKPEIVIGLQFIRAFSSVLNWHGQDFCTRCNTPLEYEAVTIPDEWVYSWYDSRASRNRMLPESITYHCSCGMENSFKTSTYPQQIVDKMYLEPTELDANELIWNKTDNYGNRPIGERFEDIFRKVKEIEDKTYDLENKIQSLEIQNEGLRHVLQSYADDPIAILRQRLLK